MSRAKTDVGGPIRVLGLQGRATRQLPTLSSSMLQPGSFRYEVILLNLIEQIAMSVKAWVHIFITLLEMAIFISEQICNFSEHAIKSVSTMLEP